MKTITTREIILESLLTTNRVIEAEIKKRTNELVLSETLNFWKSPRDYHEILGILNKFLNENSFRWVDLTLCFLRYTIRPAIFPHPKIMIFLFGKRNFILKNIKEISGRIVAGDRWMGKEAGISFHREFNFKDFI
jgi:hypothetical protein